MINAIEKFCYIASPNKTSRQTTQKHLRSLNNDVYKEIININSKLQKRWKYGLGLNLENSLLECIEIFIMAKHAPKALKAGYLIKGIGKLESTSLKLRLFLELKLANETNIFKLQASLSEIGRMLGRYLG